MRPEYPVGKALGQEAPLRRLPDDLDRVDALTAQPDPQAARLVRRCHVDEGAARHPAPESRDTARGELGVAIQALRENAGDRISTGRI